MSNHILTAYAGLNKSDYCGYCNDATADKQSHGIVTRGLTPTCYEYLMNRGWRRCGYYTYKPVMDHTCCPQYTMRLDTHNVRVTKTQRNVIKKMNSYLKTGVLPKSTPKPPPARMKKSKINRKKTNKHTENESEKKSKINLSPFTIHAIDETKLCYHRTNEQISTSVINAVELTERKKRKAKIKRAIKAVDRWKKQGNNPDEMRQNQITKRLAKTSSSSLEELLTQYDNQKDKNMHHISFTIVRVTDLVNNAAELGAEHRIYSAYQQHVHGDDEEDCDLQQFQGFLVTPMQPERNAVAGFYMGAIHLRTYIDDQIVCVSVLDVTPSVVSSVYLFYDPEYEALELGTYSALVEIAYTRCLSLLRPDVNPMRWYYMGYYVHNCQKMKYKAHFKPSELLCPETFTWHDIKKCTPKLDQTKYARFDDDLDRIDENEGSLDQVRVISFGNIVVTWPELQEEVRKLGASLDKKGIEANLIEVARLAGKQATPLLAIRL